MQLYCPSCQATFAAAAPLSAVRRPARHPDRVVLRCPTRPRPHRTSSAPPPPAGPPWGGPGPGPVHWAGEWGLAIVPDLEWWNSSTGIALTVVLRALGAVVGGLMAGSGRSPGMTTGAAVGLACGGIYMLADAATGSGAGSWTAWSGLPWRWPPRWPGRSAGGCGRRRPSCPTPSRPDTAVPWPPWSRRKSRRKAPGRPRGDDWAWPWSWSPWWPARTRPGSCSRKARRDCWRWAGRFRRRWWTCNWRPSG